MTRAEEKVKAADKWILSQENGYEFRVRDVFVAGYEAAEKDLADIAAFSSGPDGFYYGRGYQQGKKDAEKDLALTPDDIKLITKIHYEIVFKDTTGIKIGDVASEVLTRFKQIKEESHD